MKQTRFFSKIIVICSIVLLLCACSKSDNENQKTSTTKPEAVKQLEHVTLRLQWLPMCQFAGYYAAKANGFYKGEGLDVEILPGGPDFQSIPLVAGGANDFGVWTADAILIAKSKKIPVTGLAVFFRKSPLGYMVMEDSAIYGPKDFVGKKVGMIYGRDVEFAYAAMLKKEGVDRKKIIEVPEKFNLSLFYQGEYDVYSVYTYDQPYTAQKDGYKVRIISPADYGIEYYADTLFTRDELIKNRPDLVKAFVRASVKGWQWALDNPEKTVDIVLNEDKTLTRDSQTFQMKVIAPLVRYEDPARLGWINMETVTKMEKILRDQGVMKSYIPVEEAFTNKMR